MIACAASILILGTHKEISRYPGRPFRPGGTPIYTLLHIGMCSPKDYIRPNLIVIDTAKCQKLI